VRKKKGKKTRWVKKEKGQQEVDVLEVESFSWEVTGAFRTTEWKTTILVTPQ
jgi:hypothetical protein